MGRSNFMLQFQLDTSLSDAFCGPGIVHIEDGEVIALYNEVPAGAKLIKKDIDAAAFERWSLRAKAKWD